jgi:hypothetical protein
VEKIVIIGNVRTEVSSSARPESTNAPNSQPSNARQNQNTGENQIGNLLRNLLNPSNIGTAVGALGQISGGNIPNLGNLLGTSNNQRPTQPVGTPSRNRRANEPGEESKEEQKVSRSAGRRSREERKGTAQSQHNVLADAVSTVMPLINNAMSSTGNQQSQTLGELFPEEREAATSYGFKVLTNMTIPDLISLMNGNYSSLTTLQPRMRQILLSDYMNNEDTPENRQLATDKIAEELNLEGGHIRLIFIKLT